MAIQNPVPRLMTRSKSSIYISSTIITYFYHIFAIVVFVIIIMGMQQLCLWPSISMNIMMIANENNLDNISHFYGFSSTLRKELILMQQQLNNKNVCMLLYLQIVVIEIFFSFAIPEYEFIILYCTLIAVPSHWIIKESSYYKLLLGCYF